MENLTPDPGFIVYRSMDEMAPAVQAAFARVLPDLPPHYQALVEHAAYVLDADTTEEIQDLYEERFDLMIGLAKLPADVRVRLEDL